MERKIILGPYEASAEYENYWISRENLQEGTVRVIEGKLYYAVYYKLKLSEPQYNPTTNMTKDYEHVILWQPFYDSTK